jgi:hypothetical protein
VDFSTSSRNPALYELLSIGQTFVNSTDALILHNAADAADLSRDSERYLAQWPASAVRLGPEAARSASRVLDLARPDLGQVPSARL